MKRIFFVLMTVASVSFDATAQDELFGGTKAPAKKGFLIGFNGNFDLPAADMADRFGLSYRFGPSLGYKTQSNLIFGIKADFIAGNKVNEDSLMANIRSTDRDLIASDGMRANVETFERGYLIGLQAGKIINISKKNSDNGILLMTSVGFMQHKIRIANPDGTIPQISGEYKKGYDRLTNGIFVEQFVGYNHFSNSGLINFNIGFDVLAGFTQGRRDYLLDVRRPDDKSRVDLLFGIRGGWYIPIFKRKSEEFYFE